MATAAAPSGPDSPAPDSSALSPRLLAGLWVRYYAPLHKPVLERVIDALVLIAAIGLAFWPDPVPEPGFVLLGVLCVVGVILRHRSTRRAQTLTTALLDLAALPAAADSGFAATVVLVLHQAHPNLAALKHPAPEQMRAAVADAALRAFIRSDLDGCATGHHPICRHRRDNDTWMTWLGADETDETDTENQADQADPTEVAETADDQPSTHPEPPAADATTKDHS